MTVVCYRAYADIDVLFHEPVEHIRTVRGGNLIAGSIINKWHTTMRGFGIAGDYSVDIYSPVYRMYAGMLTRGVSNPSQPKSYIGCSVDPSWKYFTNFKAWFLEQPYQDGWCLEKDLLVKGNKIYSPTTCVIVPQEINNFMTDRHNLRGEWPCGVTYRKKHGNWQASCSVDGVRTYLGVFNSPEEAFSRYREEKIIVAHRLANKWEGQISDSAISALRNFDVLITD